MLSAGLSEQPISFLIFITSSMAVSRSTSCCLEREERSFWGSTSCRLIWEKTLVRAGDSPEAMRFIMALVN